MSASKWETLLLVSCFGITVVWRGLLVLYGEINPDEMFTIGSAYRLSQGLLPYFDFVELKAPLILLVYSPLVQLIGERPEFLDWFRWGHFFLALCFCGVLYIFVQRVFDRKTALWSLCILNTFAFFMERTVHVRPDLWGHILVVLAILLMLGKNGEVPSTKNKVLAAVLLGLAMNFHITMIFPVVATSIWVLFWSRYYYGKVMGYISATVFVAIIAATYLFGWVLLFGLRTPEALSLQLQAFQFDKFYQASVDYNWSHVLGRHRVDIFLWFCIIASLLFHHSRQSVLYHGKWVMRMLLLQADFGLLFVVARSHSFEQHYIFAAVYGSILAACSIRRWKLRSPIHYHLGMGNIFGFGLALVMFFIAILAAALNVTQPISQNISENIWYPNDSKTQFSISDSEELNQAAVSQMLKTNLASNGSYGVSKSDRMAQIRFILDNSGKGEVVFSDWLNPPFRCLPVHLHHGLMISHFYGSETMAGNKDAVELLHRYDPYYQKEAHSMTKRIIWLFENTNPVLICLDGSMGRLFVRSSTFRQWLAKRYQFVLDQSSGTVFALIQNRISEVPLSGKNKAMIERPLRMGKMTGYSPGT